MTDLSASFDNWFSKQKLAYASKDEELIAAEEALKAAKASGEGVLLAGAAVAKARRELNVIDRQVLICTLIEIIKSETSGGKISISVPEWEDLILQFSWGNYKANKEIGLDQPERIKQGVTEPL